MPSGEKSCSLRSTAIRSTAARYSTREDLDTALARFDQLSRPVPRLENAASRVYDRVAAYFAARDWDATATAMAQSMIDDDRRRMVNAGIRRGRDVEVANSQATAAIGGEKIMSTVIATRGERLALCRSSIVGRGEQSGAFRIEFLSVIEIDADKRLAAHVGFDLDDFDAALAELDARYLAGEAAAHAHTWSLVAASIAALNRREHPATTPDWVNIDHRRGISFAPGEVSALLANWNATPDLSNSIESVHRLNHLGAVVTSVTHETSQEGFEAEWRGISVLTIEGDLIDRLEVFDEADIDAALARFEELNHPTRRLENAASQVTQHFLARLAAGDWEAISQILADDFSQDDRRRVVGAGVRQGRDAEIADLRTIAELGTTNIVSTVIATRGELLALMRVRFSFRYQGPEAFLGELLGICQISADERILGARLFDLNDIDAAIAELDARYLAGEAAAHAHTWSLVAASYAALNRHELPPTTPDCLYIDHRRETAFGPGDLTAYVQAGFDLDQGINTYVEQVHRLNGLEAVITYATGRRRKRASTPWRGVAVLTADGDMINRCEVFDEADLDAALARFEELQPPARQLENAATQVVEHYLADFRTRSWAAIAGALADDFYIDDRRRVVNAGIRIGRDAEVQDLQAAARRRLDVNDVGCHCDARQSPRSHAN